MSQTVGFDPITLEIIQTSLQAASDEMFAAMRRTAMSAIIYEVLDMGTGITDAEGQLASSGAGISATCAATSSRRTTRTTAASRT